MKNQWSMPSARAENSIKLGSNDNKKDEIVQEVRLIFLNFEFVGLIFHDFHCRQSDT